MTTEEIVYQVKIKGYIYIFDNLGFVNVFGSDDLSECIFRTKADCTTKKEFEKECLFLGISGGF